MVGGNFTFENKAATDRSGELMVQARQDIRIDGATMLTHDGRRSMLFEAQKTIAFGTLGNTTSTRKDFTVTMDGTTKNGDLTIKAGYPNFYPTADVNSPLNWGAGTCAPGNYLNREADNSTSTGGDIWFGGNATITLTPTLSDSVDTYIRAYNSIYMDGKFKHSLESAYTPGSALVDTTMLYAETGNLEAINVVGDSVSFEISAKDSVYLLLQAGNSLGNPCGSTICSSDEWHGNVLFGNMKPFTVNHDGVGPTLISASRDIENQVDANITFNYTNTGLGSKDNLTITAGRHIETHAPYLFDYSAAGLGIESSITMQAGHQTSNCNYLLCKTTEVASNLNYNASNLNTKDNTFSMNGEGHGSILAFNTIDFNYQGVETILMTALNGNIETDPYLHKGSGPGYPG
ncbi:MAG: hypothetical protein LBV74_03390, partial [Tannerella sp.]|nr:hypothetical protein [Tannerella sp.]